ncbi:MAG: glycosyltransferase, partial [Candidatus Hydrogenedentes bacterium]|nr:glycosyltransferase [Candidatus Hydrogenedentota bacterium]
MNPRTKNFTILHLFSNHRWTGPAEPALTLIKNLKELGWDIYFACSVRGVPKNKYNKVHDSAINFKIPTLTQFYLSKHRNIFKDFWDQLNLKRLFEKKNFSLIHCHLDNDHRLATKIGKQYKIPVVRSNYYGGEGLPVTLKRLISHTNLIFEYSKLSQKKDIENFNLSEEKCPLVPLAIDLDRFSPER